MKQRWRLRIEIIRMAVTAHARPAIAAIKIPLRRPINVIRDHEIEPAVVVVVEPCRARCPATSVGDPCALRHIRESAVAVIAIKNAASVAAQEQIGESVVVIIADRKTHAEQAFRTDACSCGDIRKRAAAVIAIESTSQPVGRLVRRSCSAVD